jgi:hypothetical protein
MSSTGLPELGPKSTHQAKPIKSAMLWNFPMLTEFEEIESKTALQSWRDSLAEIDPANHSDLVPALSRLLGWLAEGEKCEQKGMRVVALLICVRPDFIEPKSFGRMSRASKRVCNELVNDFRSTFTLRSDRKM